MSIRRHASKSGATSYYVYVQDGGRPRYVGKRATKADARQLETVERARRARLPAGQAEAPGTLDAAWERVSPALSKRSHEIYARVWRNCIQPHLGSLRLEQVTALQIATLRGRLEADEYAPATVGLALRVLSVILGKCAGERWVETNAARGAARGLHKAKVDMDGQAAEDLRFIGTADDMAKVLRAAPAGTARDLIAFGFMTGCRIGEVCAVDWQDVYLETGKLCIRRSQKGQTKSGKSRWMPIQRQLRPILERRWLAAGRPGKGRVFPEVWGYTDPAGLARQHLNSALVESGIGHYTTHEAFRHTFASHFVMAGGSIFQLAKYLGHSDAKITFAVYYHLAPGAFAADEDRIQLPPFEGRDAEIIPMTTAPAPAG